MAGKNRVLLGMSGGVDSAVAAWLLQQQGYEVVGATLRLQDEATEQAGSALQDMADAEKVAYSLGIRHLVVDWRSQFREKVLDYFAGQYDSGRTPNPCVTCNPNVKFPALLWAAGEEGIAHIATGHYARILQRDGQYLLAKGTNQRKDQSYALCGLNREWLGRILFPLGEMDKEQVRKLAAEAGISISKKADSQDICFVPDGDYAAFLQRYTGHGGTQGEFVTLGGTVLGRHKGIRHYTLGQRKGLGISLGAPTFVSEIRPESGQVVLGANEDLFCGNLLAENVNWLIEPLREPFRAEVKIRYAHTPQPATVVPQEDGRAKVFFEQPQRAITPGQAAVFYSGDVLLGGGTIAVKTAG